MRQENTDGARSMLTTLSFLSFPQAASLFQRQWVEAGLASDGGEELATSNQVLFLPFNIIYKQSGTLALQYYFEVVRFARRRATGAFS